MVDIKDPNFWEEIWERNRRKSSSKSDLKGYQEYPIDKWNKRAVSFARQTDGKKLEKRWENVKSFLLRQGFTFKPKMKVLDIGAGPGNFAIWFARMGLEVWALEPAEKMLELLKQRVASESLQGIYTIAEKWEDIDLSAKGWFKKFDLVFASMTPGINDKTTLQKMMDASRGYCYLSSFAGTRIYPLQKEISKEILGQDYKTYTPEIIYPFNLLYSMGYYPDIEFEENNSSQEVLVEDVQAEIISHIEMYTTITPEIEAKIKNYLYSQAVNNKIVKKTKSRIGKMIWKV
jgi:SAM-dependent methyltransferase